MADRRHFDNSSDQEYEEEEDVFASPSPSKPPRGPRATRPGSTQQQRQPTSDGRSKTPTTAPPAPNQNNNARIFDAQEAREAALRRELEGVRNINQVIEGVIGTLERAKGNMGVCHCSFSPSKHFQPSSLITPKLQFFSFLLL